MLVVIALSLLGSVVLSGLRTASPSSCSSARAVAGLLGSIGHALNSHAIKHASTIASWALPFEALYQDGLRMITENTFGLTGSCCSSVRSAAPTCTVADPRVGGRLSRARAAAAVALFSRKDL